MRCRRRRAARKHARWNDGKPRHPSSRRWIRYGEASCDLPVDDCTKPRRTCISHESHSGEASRGFAVGFTYPGAIDGARAHPPRSPAHPRSLSIRRSDAWSPSPCGIGRRALLIHRARRSIRTKTAGTPREVPAVFPSSVVSSSVSRFSSADQRLAMGSGLPSRSQVALPLARTAPRSRMPATCGAAMEVPLMDVVPPPLRVETMLTPGAA